MNDSNVSQTHASPWLSYVYEIIVDKKAGRFTTRDDEGKPVTIDWFTANLLSEELAQAKKTAADLAAHVTAAGELQFLRQHPEAVSQEMFLKPCEPLFANGLESVDWQKVEQTIQETVKQFYCIDMNSFGEALKPLMDDVIIYASITEEDRLLGFMIASITPALAFGDIKLITLIVEPTEPGRGLDRLLVATLLKIVPKVERIFCSIRSTNELVRATYESWGFTRDLNPAQDPAHTINENYFMVLGYQLNQSSALQEAAALLV